MITPCSPSETALLELLLTLASFECTMVPPKG
jgi:hypothetical protein